MRPSPLTLPALAAALAFVLACAGAASPVAEDEVKPTVAASRPPPPAAVVVPFRNVGASTWSWPRADLTSTALMAIDDDPGTIWTPTDDESAVFFVAGAPSEIRVDGALAGGQVRLWTQGPKRWKPILSDWTALARDGASWVAPLTTTGRLLGVEVRPAGPVHTVAAVGRPASETTRTWEISMTAATDRPFVDWPQARIGEIDLDACTVRKPGAGPGEDFAGTCELTSSGLRLNGAIGGHGAIDETLPIADFGPCLKVVGGWPYTRCQ